MKIIHTADLHLDSPLLAVADAKTRRQDLIRALFNLSEYANNNGVAAVVVAGDLFDEEAVSEQTVQSVADIIAESKAQWFVLRGNHGSTIPYERLSALCPAVRFFGEEWTSYSTGGVTICGRELGVDDVERWQKLHLDSSQYNILVSHGDIDNPIYGLIDKKQISTLPIKYVALGHRHCFSCHKFGRVSACYSGVLEARGFDETEKTGFVLVDTDKDQITFVPQSIRSVETVKVDVTGVDTDLALEKRLSAATSEVSARNYLNLVLVGTLSQGVRLLPVAKNMLNGRFFALRIEDKTETAQDLQQLKQEVSLRGEFVKLALEIQDERLRNEVLKMGLSALSGEVEL